MPNLTKDEHVLIAYEPTGLKYEFAQRFSIKTVSIEWLDQCIERGMVLEDKYFNHLIPREVRGTNAWIRKSSSNVSLGKHGRDEINSGRSRKLRRTASAKLDTVNTGIWAEISQPIKDDTLDDDKSRVSNIQAAPNLEPIIDLPHPAPRQSLVGENEQPKSLFDGKAFALFGFSSHKASRVEHYLGGRGARFIDFITLTSAESSTLENIFLMVPHEISNSQLPEIAELFPPQNIVTEFWAERCMYSKQYEDPHSHALNRPFEKLPIPDFDTLKVTSTGFQGFERNHAAKAVMALGGTYNESFDATFSLLICDPKFASKEKLAHAFLWGVPAVQAQWLWDCIRNGKLMEVGPYLVQQIGPPLEEETESISFNTENGPSSPSRNARARRSPSKAVTKAKNISAPGKDSNNAKGAETKVTKPRKVDTFPDDSGPLIEEPVPTDSPTKSIPQKLPSQSSSALPNRSSLPLQEITPNSSPPKPFHKPNANVTIIESFTKPSSPSPHKAPPQPDTLKDDIQSLLLQRKASNSRIPTNPDPPQRGRRRNRRPLLGRAPSNISTHSRASSVDTSTPILSACSTNAPPQSLLSNRHSSNSNVVYDNEAAEQEERRRDEEKLALTQVGYDDPDAAFYRREVEKKMGKGGKGKMTYGKGGGTPKRSWIGVGEGGRGKGKAGGGEEGEGLGIARRTRGAVGR